MHLKEHNSKQFTLFKITTKEKTKKYMQTILNGISLTFSINLVDCKCTTLQRYINYYLNI